VRAVRIHRRGDPPELVYEAAPTPALATGDVLLEVRAASFTPDEMTWPGTWVDRAGRDRTPSVPCHEVAGVVSELGYGSTGFAVGDRVFGLTDWHRDGAAAEYVAVEARNLAPMPSSMSFVDAAALPLPALTAWQGLFVHGGLDAGQTVVVHGAAGGVGTFAIQLARAADAHVVATGRAAHAELAGELGAESFVDLEGESFDEVVGAADLVFDTVGGDVLATSSRGVRPGGTIVSITGPPDAPQAGRAVVFIVEPDRAQLTELARRYESGSLRSHVGAVYPLAAAREAFAAKWRGVPGKVVLEV
jgi:NADPH:quinone reductase-like Zn-dependent oxidoreductase